MGRGYYNGLGAVWSHFVGRVPPVPLRRLRQDVITIGAGVVPKLQIGDAPMALSFSSFVPSFGSRSKPLRYTRLLLEVRMKSVKKTLVLVAITIAAAGMAGAQVPPDIAKQLVAIGRGVCVPETAQVYRPCIRTRLIRVCLLPATSHLDPIPKMSSTCFPRRRAQVRVLC